jgi:hypothetical protein
MYLNSFVSANILLRIQNFKRPLVLAGFVAFLTTRIRQNDTNTLESLAERMSFHMR